LLWALARLGALCPKYPHIPRFTTVYK
jgi:hypothetical protein